MRPTITLRPPQKVTVVEFLDVARLHVGVEPILDNGLYFSGRGVRDHHIRSLPVARGSGEPEFVGVI